MFNEKETNARSPIQKAPFEISQSKRGANDNLHDSNLKPNNNINATPYITEQDATSMASIRFLDNQNSVMKTGICGPCGCAFISH